MLEVKYSTKFRKDVKIVQKRGLNLLELKSVMKDLENEVELDEKYKDHLLKGDWANHRECHIQPDWLLIYYIVGEVLHFVRTGTHSDLF